MATIGFIGLGIMGAHMARNLLKGGHRLVVNGAYPVPADLREQTQVVANSTAVAQAADIVIAMVPDTPDVRNVLFAEDGVAKGLSAGKLVIDMSSISPLDTREFAKEINALGCDYLDAPVSGGTGGAAAGTLTFMVGGDDADYARAKPVLAAIGKNIVHCGATGMGQVAKVCNNLVLGITMAGVSEAMALGASLGIDPKVLAGIINTSTGRCWSSDTYNPYPGVIETAPSSRGYTGGFGTDLMLKDLGLANDAAKQARQPVYLGALAQQLYQTMSSRGDGKLDFSAVIRLYRPLGKDA